MTTLLLSIKPEHVARILDRSKKYEFRKTVCRKPVDRIVVYCTSPVKKVVAEARVSDIIVDKPERVWNLTCNASGITKDFFDSYFRDADLAVAYHLDNIEEYASPKQLSDIGIKNAPQSFLYLDRLAGAMPSTAYPGLRPV